MNPTEVTVGILYPGEMGAALGGILGSRGIRVVTTTADRSQRTVSACHESQLEVLPSLDAVKQVAHVMISAVVPTAAHQVAEAYTRAEAVAPKNAIYLDINSVSPEVMASIQQLLAAHHVPLVDAAIHGLAAHLQSRGTLYLSGPQANHVAMLFHDTIRTQQLGDVVGAASRFKMMLGGMSKGLVALFVELAILARTAGEYEQFSAELAHYYPGITTAIERLIPTYPLHAERRGTELREVGNTMRAHGTVPRMVSAAEKVISELGEIDWQARFHAGHRWSVSDVTEQAYAHHSTSTVPVLHPGSSDLKTDGPSLT